MMQLIAMLLLAAAPSLQANDTKGLIAGEVSPATEETGEVDEDIIITDEEDTNDDEGVED